MRNTEHLPYQIEKNNHQSWFYKKSCSQKFCVIHRETSVLDLFFIKMQTVRPATLLNRDSNVGIFLLRNFEKHLLEEHLRTAASELTLQSDCLELYFWTIALKTILTL